MGKKGVSKSFLEEMVGDAPKTDKRPTLNARTTDKRPTNDAQKTPLERYQFRLHPEDWRRLQHHFEAKGISVSAGLRMIIKEHLDREGLA